MTTRIIRDDLDKFFDYGINIPTRTIYLGSLDYDAEDDETGVDYGMAERAIKSLHLLDSVSAEGGKPIYILMNNPGGFLYHGLAIYDAIKACKNPVTITVYGMAMSMGSVILQAADERIMAPNSSLMIHYGSLGIEADIKVVENYMKEMNKHNIWLEDLYLSKIRDMHPKFTRKKVVDMCTMDTYFTAQEALEIGLADSILK